VATRATAKGKLDASIVWSLPSRGMIMRGRP
jgi:hypothetical protein